MKQNRYFIIIINLNPNNQQKRGNKKRNETIFFIRISNKVGLLPKTLFFF
jgi:hypothetical protein